MCDEHDRWPGLVCGNPFNDGALTGGIERAGGFVEKQQTWPAQQGTGNGDALTLPAGHQDAPLTEHAVQSMLHAGDRDRQGLVHIVVGRPGRCPAQIVANRVVKQKCVFRNVDDRAPPGRKPRWAQNGSPTVIRPACGMWSPTRRSRMVVFPAPEGPLKPTEGIEARG